MVDDAGLRPNEIASADVEEHNLKLYYCLLQIQQGRLIQRFVAF